MAEQWQTLLFETCEKGVSSAVAPELLPDTQVAWGGNVSIRGGKPYTRPPWTLRADLPRGLIQGGEYFGVQGGMLVISIAGHLYRIRINNRSFEVEQISLGFENSGIIKQVWMCQTVETLVIQDGQSNAILYNGSVAPRSTGNQVPRGKMMAYGNGRLWLAINDKELIAGDIRTRNAGSELKFTETNYLTGGGSLYFPRGMTGLSFIPVTGQADYGALLAYGLDYTKAIRADVTQRDQWQSIPGFEQSILNSVGAASQWSIVSVNQDLYWRDSNGGIRSIRNALADEQGPGSSPISREVSRLADYDSQQLMPWCSGVYHDNRLLMTSSPFLLPNGGIGWKNLIALDFSPLSTIQGKSQASYDGQWSGLSIVKLLGGDFRNKNRAFALTTDVDGNNQLWETGGADIADMTGLCGQEFASVPNPIRSWIEYPRRNFGIAKHRKRLERCDVWLSNVDGELDLAVYWRADNSQKWLQWDEATTCAKTTDASTETPHVWKNLLQQERPQFKTFTIPQNINELVGYAAEVGFEFQIRLVWTGYAKIHRMMTYGTVLEDPNFAMRDEYQVACIENDVSGNDVIYTVPTESCEQESSIQVRQEALNIPIGTNYSFGDSTDLQIDVEFTIHNPSEEILEIGEVTNEPTDNFVILTQPDSTIDPGENSTFTVRFTSTIDPVSSEISIPNNTHLNPFVFTVYKPNGCENVGTLNYRSKTGGIPGYSSSALMCGFSEFANPSIPPKKYLRVTNSGSIRNRIFQPSTVCDPSAVIDDSTVNYSGDGFYEPATCTLDCSAIVNGTCGPTNLGAPACSLTMDKTISISQGLGCVVWSPIQSRQFDGSWINTLSDEDTEHDAIVRNNLTFGYDAVAATVAKIPTRGAGVFSFTYTWVQWRKQVSGLTMGSTYSVGVVYGRRAYGSSDPFVAFASEEVEFVAAGGTEQTPYTDIPNESGFETNVLTAYICNPAP